jgi:biopolymer transport protein ExbB
MNQCRRAGAILALALLTATASSSTVCAQSDAAPAAQTRPKPLPATPAAAAPQASAEAVPSPAPQRPAGIEAMLPRDLSPWGMFQSADTVVKAVLILLLLASIATWTVWLSKTIELIGARRRLRQAMSGIAEAPSLADADRLAGSISPAADLIRAAAAELRLSPDMPADGVKERVASRLERLEAAANRRMLRGTGILATIGATSPFVGLFGTVWGIMNSFIGISKAQTTNLAVVAPGIAEALLATALGLVAAIPAVIIYNAFARSIAGYRQMLGDISAAILRLVGRDLDRRRAPLAKAAE